MPREINYVHIESQIVLQETGLAFLFLLDGDENVWVPKSVMADADDYNVGDTDRTVSIQDWFAEKEGIG